GGRGVVRVVGLDVDRGMLTYARARTRREGVGYVQGNAHSLPLPNGSFDGVVCHYLLLWLADPGHGVAEMARVTRPGGHVLACAEPDYGGRVDHPPELAPLGRMQAEGLRRQGADPEMGRKLGELFVAAGLETTVGVMAGQWELSGAFAADFEAEWTMRERDLIGLCSREELDRLRGVDHQAVAVGRRMLFVPTFYAWGKKSAL
ncbi:MAG TPA: methyltransferase domain-containing protein, partial [Chloroflexi bacterium]|nr:methyltransferase domain-containing protein [Chloroflexota bacterium]